jgi:dihydrofolate reductase
VLTKKTDFAASGVLIAHSLEDAFAAALKSGAAECFVIGGAEIYKQALPLCQKLYITRVHGMFEGSTYMPEFESGFRRIEIVKNFKDEQNLYDYDFEMWESLSKVKA